MSGQIYIEPNGGHQSAYELARGGEWVEFKDGIDDFTYLEIDGQVVLNDNNWTGVGSPRTVAVTSVSLTPAILSSTMVSGFPSR